MAKRKLKITYSDTMDDGKRLVLEFNRPVNPLEANGIVQIVNNILESLR